jgi:biotin synthase-like enzyme
MWKVCLMKMLRRRATFDTHLKSYVPQWHVYVIERAKNYRIWHIFTKPQQDHACLIWHASNFVGGAFGKTHTSCKGMINFQFRCCNHRCEVCGKSDYIKINRDRHNNTETEIYTDRNISIFTAGKNNFCLQN